MSERERPKNFRLLTRREAARLLAKMLDGLPPEPTFQDERWVRIKADHGLGCCVWHKNGGGSPACSLPIPPELVARMDRWQNDFETIWGSDDGATPLTDIGAFCAEGRAIAQAVKQTLPDWTVLYFDESRYEAYRADRHADHGPITYEIILAAPFEAPAAP